MRTEIEDSAWRLIKQWPILATAALMATSAQPSGALAAVAYDYANSASGNWSDTTNWSPSGVPDGALSDTANLADVVTPRTVTYDAAAPGTLAATTIGNNNTLLFTATLPTITAGSITVKNGGTLDYGRKLDATVVAGLASGSGAGFLLGNAGPANGTTLNFTNAGNVSIGASANYTLSTSAITTFTPNNSTYRLGGGAATLTVQGALLTGAGNSLVVAGGRVNLGTSNGTYGGSTTINDGGTLVESAANRIPAATALIVNGTGLFDAGVNSASKVTTVSSLSGNGTVNITTAGSVSTTLRVLGANDTIFSGQINDGSVSGATLAFTKDGTSQLTLSGNNGYSGGTTVSNGTLRISNTGSVANSAFSISGTGTLAGRGIAGSSVTAAAGTIAAGDTTGSGTLSVGSLALSGTAADSVVLNGATAGQYSQISLTSGGATLGGNLQIAVNYAAQIGDTFAILQDAIGNTSGITGTFANVTPVLPTTGTINSGTYSFLVTYAPTAVTLTVTAVPEPATLGLVGLGGLLLGRRRRAAR